MIEILNAVHNIVSVSPEDLPEHPRERQTIYYSDEKDMVVIAGWGDDTGRIAEMIVNYLELSPEGKQKAEEYFPSSGEDFGIRINNMLKEIARIRREKGQFTMRTDEIRIFPCFADHPPKPEKMENKDLYYQAHGSFESGIILDGTGNLIDGYTSYLLAVRYGVSHVPVRYGRRQTIKAAHRPGGPLYSWELPGLLVGKVHPGDKVTVRTARGYRRVTVEAVEEYAGQGQEPLKMVVRKGRMRRR